MKLILSTFPRSAKTFLQRLLLEYVSITNNKSSIPSNYFDIDYDLGGGNSVVSGGKFRPIKIRKIKEAYFKNKTSGADQYAISHDFKGALEIRGDIKYVILYRENMIDQLEAFYRFNIDPHLGPRDPRVPDYKIEKNLNTLKSFIKTRKPYYDYFINKWVNTDRENTFKLEMYDLFKNPIKKITECINFIEGESSPSNEILKNKRLISSIESMNYDLMKKSCQDRIPPETRRILQEFIDNECNK